MNNSFEFVVRFVTLFFLCEQDEENKFNRLKDFQPCFLNIKCKLHRVI